MKNTDKKEVKYPRRWERICGGLARLKTPVGWLITDTEDRVGYFLPDPEHEWVLED